MSSVWMWPYFVGVMVFSYLGNFGGHGIIKPLPIMVLMAIFCLFILVLAVFFKNSPDQAEIEIIEAIEE